MNYNKVIMAGNLTRDPEVRTTGTGKKVCSFTIAVNERRASRDAGGQEPPPMFVKVDAWERLADVCGQYLKKGSGVLVEGRLRMEEWDGRDGQKRRDPAITASDVQFFGSRPGGGEAGSIREDGPGGDRGYGGGGSSRSEPPRRSEPDAGYSRGPAAGGTEDDLPF